MTWTWKLRAREMAGEFWLGDPDSKMYGECTVHSLRYLSPVEPYRNFCRVPISRWWAGWTEDSIAFNGTDYSQYGVYENIKFYILKNSTQECITPTSTEAFEAAWVPIADTAAEI